MSHISTMAVREGIVMTADRMFMAVGKREIPIFKKKLFTMGDNIGLSILCHYASNDIDLYHELANYCRNYSFNNVREAFETLWEWFIPNLYKYCNGSTYIMHIAGYDKIKTISGRMYTEPEPKMYCITNYKTDQEGVLVPRERFMCHGCGSDSVKQYGDMVNRVIDYNDYSLQDAVDFSKLIHTMGREYMRFMCRMDAISEDIDMIAVTPDGIQQIKRYEMKLIEEEK